MDTLPSHKATVTDFNPELDDDNPSYGFSRMLSEGCSPERMPQRGGVSTESKPQPTPSTAPPKVDPDKEIIIALMGVTGAGKSYFIREVSGLRDVRVGETLQSCTSHITPHIFYYAGTKITLVDNPGFNDTFRTDTDILKDIVAWTSSTYKEKRLLTGIIYMHRISDVRMEGSALKNLRMFKNLCGNKALQNVILATTHWSNVAPELGAKREQELRTTDNYFKGLLDCGASLKRFTGDRASGLELIHQLMGATPKALDIQHQIVDEQKELKDTSAGQTINAELLALEKKYQEELQNTKEELENAKKEMDKEMEKILNRERELTEQKLQKIDQETKELVAKQAEDMKRREQEMRNRESEAKQRAAEERQERQERQRELQLQAQQWAAMYEQQRQQILFEQQRMQQASWEAQRDQTEKKDEKINAQDEKIKAQDAEIREIRAQDAEIRAQDAEIRAQHLQKAFQQAQNSAAEEKGLRLRVEIEKAAREKALKEQLKIAKAKLRETKVRETKVKEEAKMRGTKVKEEAKMRETAKSGETKLGGTEKGGKAKLRKTEKKEKAEQCCIVM